MSADERVGQTRTPTATEAARTDRGMGVVDAADGEGQPGRIGLDAAERAGEGRLALRHGDGLAPVVVELKRVGVHQRHGDGVGTGSGRQRRGARHAEVVVVRAPVVRLGARPVGLGGRDRAQGVAALPRQASEGRTVAQRALETTGGGRTEHVDEGRGGAAARSSANEQNGVRVALEHVEGADETGRRHRTARAGADGKTQHERTGARGGSGAPGIQTTATRRRDDDGGRRAARTAELGTRVGRRAVQRHGADGQRRHVGGGSKPSGVTDVGIRIGGEVVVDLAGSGRIGLVAGGGAGGGSTAPEDERATSGLGGELVSRSATLTALRRTTPSAGRTARPARRTARPATGASGEIGLGAGLAGLPMRQAERAVAVGHRLDDHPGRVRPADLGDQPRVEGETRAVERTIRGVIRVVRLAGRIPQRVAAEALLERDFEVVEIDI